ncbi:MAG: amino acid adenylation domain-containing protein [Polyangiales bacterium]
MTEPSIPSNVEPQLSVAHGASRAALALGEADEPLHVRFARYARARPDAIAARCGDASITYAALDARAESLAKRLTVDHGVHPESMVAVCVAPSLEVLVAILAIFKAGAVYVPLDPTHPRALIADILAEVNAQVVLTDARSSAALPTSAAMLRIDLPVDAPDALAVLPRVGLGHAAYVLYTSGTTGRPKGVVATHGNLAHYLGVARARFGFSQDDVFCSLARYTFSISFFELLSPLGAGASVVLLPRDVVLDPARLSDVLSAVTVLHAGPSLLASSFRHLRASGRTFAGMRHASTGGDLVPPHVLEEMRTVFPRAERFVLYGCTEISCMGTFAEVPRAGAIARTLVGQPFADMTVRVVDDAGALVARGEVGEVCFAGKGVARRYLARPALTSEKFVCIDGQRFYRTGDVARMHEDGALELLGRRDFQVQLRGIRVELGGIEHTLVALGLAGQAAVVPERRGDDDVRLVAFLVDARGDDLATVRRALAERLPEYMLPQAVRVLPAMPLTANGKLDRRALLALASEPTDARPRAARTPITDAGERAIADAFQRVLGVEATGRDDDFFDLGGHSLTAVLLLSDLQDRLGVTLAPSVLFENATVRGLAEAARGDARVEQRPILLSERADRPALFMLLGVHLYRELARELEGSLAVYGVYASRELSLLEGNADAPSISELAREYIAIIRRQQPEGPYRIGGMSFGGIVAYEVAQQLEDDGEVVESLVLLDAVLPQAGLDKLRRLAALPSRTLMHEVTTRLRTRLGGGRVGIDPSFLAHQHDAALNAIEAQRQSAYRAAAVAYLGQMRPFHGDTTLVVAGTRIARDRLQDPRCGFARLVPRLTVHTFAAEHLELLAAPSVREVAAALRVDLARTADSQVSPLARADSAPALREVVV